MSVARIATRYAKTLIDLAQSQDKLDRVLEDVHALKSAIKGSEEFRMLLKSPIIKGDKKTAILNQIFGAKFDPLTMAFIHILIKKGRESSLQEIGVEFIGQFKIIRHISTVTLTTAVPVSESTVKTIHDRLERSKSTDTNVEIITKVDPHLLGGFILQFDDNIYDASIIHKLDQLKKEFKDNLYISKVISR